MAKYQTSNRQIFGATQSKGGGGSNSQPQQPMPSKQSPSPPKPSGDDQFSTPVGSIDFKFRWFPSVYAMEKAANWQTANFSLAHNKESWSYYHDSIGYRYNDTGWFGSPAAKSPQDIFNHNEFLWMDLYKKVKIEVKQTLRKLRKLKTENTIPVRKIAWNALELGMFSFDRASVGLHKTLNADGEQVLTTSKEDVFAYYNPKETGQRSIKIYNYVGGHSGLTGDQLIYVGVGMAVLSEELERIGVKTQIELILGSSGHGSDGKKGIFTIVCVKKYESQMRVNDLLLVASSPRYFRYKGFKTYLSTCDYFKVPVEKGFGYGVSLNELRTALKPENDRQKIAFILAGRQAYSHEKCVEEITTIVSKIEDKTIFK